jgi:thiol-disulfide isomerase/thioredoxin
MAADEHHFVAEVKKGGLSRSYAETLARFADMFGERDQSKLIVTAINDVLPLAKPSNDPRVNHTYQLLEGIGRRLDLVGKPLELDGKLLDGGTLDWDDYRGKVVLVDFFASWCGPCREEAPNVLKYYKLYHNRGFEVIGVNLDDDPRNAEKYIKETGCDFPTIFSNDPKANGWNLPIVLKYGINAIPRVMLVDKDGNVVSTSARGPMLGELLAKLLGPPTDGKGDSDATKSSGTGSARAGAQAARSAALR